MDQRDLLLLVAFRHKIEEPDLDNGLVRVMALAGRDLDLKTIHSVLAEVLADGYIRDPIQLRHGALQCRWHLELTSRGVGQVLRLLRDHGKTADELLAGAGIPNY